VGWRTGVVEDVGVGRALFSSQWVRDGAVPLSRKMNCLFEVVCSDAF